MIITEMFWNWVKLGASVGKKVFGYASHIIACVLACIVNLITSLFMNNKSCSVKKVARNFRKFLCPIGAVVGAGVAALSITLPPILILVSIVVKSWRKVVDAFIIVCESGPEAITSVFSTATVMASILAITVAIIVAINKCSAKKIHRQFLEELSKCIG